MLYGMVWASTNQRGYDDDEANYRNWAHGGALGHLDRLPTVSHSIRVHASACVCGSAWRFAVDRVPLKGEDTTMTPDRESDPMVEEEGITGGWFYWYCFPVLVLMVLLPWLFAR